VQRLFREFNNTAFLHDLTSIPRFTTVKLCEDDIKTDIGCEINSTGSGYGAGIGYCEHDSKEGGGDFIA
jgi:hypothetical protein